MKHLNKLSILSFVFFLCSCSSHGIKSEFECGINTLKDGNIKTRRTGDGESIDNPNMYLFSVVAPINVDNNKLDHIQLMVGEKDSRLLIDARLGLYIKDNHASSDFSMDKMFLDGDVCIKAVYNSLQDRNKEVIFSGILTKENTTIFNENWE